jgi:hypothetical protein
MRERDFVGSGEDCEGYCLVERSKSENDESGIQWTVHSLNEEVLEAERGENSSLLTPVLLNQVNSVLGSRD